MEIPVYRDVPIPSRAKRGKPGSLFTKALRAKNEDRNLIVWRGELSFIIMNRYPYNSGHLLIVPNRQVSRMEDHLFERPDGLTLMEICAVSGLLPTSDCQNTQTEWFISGTEPTQPGATYQQVWVDTLPNSLANDSTPVERRQSITVLDLPVEAQDWARAQGFHLLTDFAPDSDSVLLNSQEQAPDSKLVLLSPHDNTTYRIDPNLDLSMHLADQT